MKFNGAKVKLSRALGIALTPKAQKYMEKRPYPPGQHGQARKKLSEYAVRLQEKQKVRLNYGIGERQLRKLIVEARTSNLSTGHKLLELLERRLDNVVFRAGFARTIPAARQLVNHGHVLVDGKPVDISSYRVNTGQTVSIRPKSKDMQAIAQGAAIAETFQTPWLEVDRPQLAAKMTTLPDETSVLFPLRVQLVVEYYSARL